MVKALDLSSNGQLSAWVQVPLLAHYFFYFFLSLSCKKSNYPFYMWLITHPVIEICIQTYHSKRTRTSKTKAIILSPLIYISYGYLFLKGNKYIKEPIVFNLCQLYSILIIAPVLFKRAFYFGLLQNEEIKLQTKNKWYIGILDVCLFVWFISYLIQEISQSFSESSVFVDNGFNVFANISMTNKHFHAKCGLQVQLQHNVMLNKNEGQ